MSTKSTKGTEFLKSRSGILPLLLYNSECIFTWFGSRQCYGFRMIERVVHVARNFKEAEEWDRRQMREMSPSERLLAARELQLRAHPYAQDVRACPRPNK